MSKWLCNLPFQSGSPSGISESLQSDGSGGRPVRWATVVVIVTVSPAAHW